MLLHVTYSVFVTAYKYSANVTKFSTVVVAVGDPVSDTTVDHLVDGVNRSSQMDADEFQLHAAESDESL
jgi:hypothetical protein